MARARLLLCLLLAPVLLGLWPAQSPAALPPLSSFKHVSWPMEGGAPSRINSIGQSRDGYLWIGSVEGLFRFDGVGFEQIRPEGGLGQKIVVAEVLGTRTGDLWVGLARSGGVAVYRHGRLVDAHMPNPSREVTGLAEDRDGAIWVARGGRSNDILARYSGGHWREYGPADGLPDDRIWGVHAARDGTLRVILAGTIVMKRAGSEKFEPTHEHVTPRASIAEDALGRIWVSDARSTRLLGRDGAAPASPARVDGTVIPHGDAVGGSKILFDRDDRLWGTTWTDGVFQISGIGAGTPKAGVNDQRIAGLASAQGLTSDQAHALFVDREGNVWIGTELGLDMLRPASIVPEPAIPANSPQGYRIAAARDGAVYVSDSDALYVIAPGGGARLVMRTTSLPGALCASRAGGIWMTLDDSIVHVDGPRRTSFRRPHTNAYGCAEDDAGRLWLPGLDNGLFWLRDGRWQAWPGPGATKARPANAARAPSGEAAILFRSKPVLGNALPFDPIFKEKLKIGEIEGLLPGTASLYVGGAKGLARIGRGPVAILPAEHYPWAASVNGMVQTPAGDTWTIGDAGVVRVKTSALDAAFDRPAPLPVQLLDFRDGLNSFAQKNPGTQMVAGGDGRIWFLTRRNVLQIDPRQLRRNDLPPNVVVTALSSEKAQFRDPRRIALPAGTTSVRIRYTALSLSVPSRIRFRYRLDGRDDRWIDAGNRREAIYDNLGPGSFVFRIVASNNDGVWNETGATLRFTIAPTLTQTLSFRIACALAFAGLLWGLYSLRLRQVSGRIRARMEERAHERERIAREIHDTLLQGVQGLILRFQSVADLHPEGDPMKAVLESALERADQLVIEGRDQVRDLRLIDNRPLDVIVRELAAQQPFPDTTQFESASTGIPRALQPLVLHDVVRIAGEALFNAAVHAAPRTVKTQIVYGYRQLEIVIADDGTGFETAAPDAAPRAHFGIIGMHERAAKMGAQLSIDSMPGFGTRVVLTVPATLAYLKAPSANGEADPPGSRA